MPIKVSKLSKEKLRFLVASLGAIVAGLVLATSMASPAQAVPAQCVSYVVNVLNGTAGPLTHAACNAAGTHTSAGWDKCYDLFTSQGGLTGIEATRACNLGANY